MVHISMTVYVKYLVIHFCDNFLYMYFATVILVQFSANDLSSKFNNGLYMEPVGV